MTKEPSHTHQAQMADAPGAKLTSPELLEKLRRLKSVIAAIAATGAILSGLYGYWDVFKKVRPTTPPVSIEAIKAVTAMAYARKGMKQDSTTAMAASLKVEPDLTVAKFLRYPAISVGMVSPAYRDWVERILTPLLRQTGLPD